MTKAEKRTRRLTRRATFRHSSFMLRYCFSGGTIVLARFFIDRPVLAWVISIVIVLLGAIAAGLLPVAEYPEITPPTVRVTANYPGANSQVVADTVAAPIEQQVVGVEGMLYMSSQSSNDGSYTL